MSTPPELPGTVTLKLYSRPRVEFSEKDKDGNQEPTICLPDLHKQALAVLALNEIVGLSLKEAPLIGELFPELMRRCLENIIASCDVILAVPCSQRNQDEMLQNLVLTLQVLIPHMKSGLNVALAMLRRILDWHITESPFRPAPSLDSALVSCCRAFHQLLSSTGSEGVSMSAEIDQVKVEPLIALKVRMMSNQADLW
jgi:hypothetical protein